MSSAFSGDHELPSTSMPDRRLALRVRDLRHRFGQKPVLHGLSFDVLQGEIFGFIGPNGAGKTTTIRAIATLIAPSSGTIELYGVDVTRAPGAVRPRLGYAPDHAGLYPGLTAREYLLFFTRAFGFPASRVDEVLEQMGLAPVAEQRAVALSKGWKQRLQIARAILHRPSFLLLDEPLSDLDVRARIEMRDVLLDYRRRGGTIFISSHILAELSELCTSVGILEQGRLVLQGPIDRVVTGASSGDVPAELKTQIVAIKLGEPPGFDLQTLLSLPSVVAVQVNPPQLEVTYRGGEQAIGQIVRWLVQQGASVIEVSRRSGNLERAFLSATAPTSS